MQRQATSNNQRNRVRAASNGVAAAARNGQRRVRGHDGSVPDAAWFRALIENATDSITVVNRRGVVVYDSPNRHRLLGNRVDELCGQDALGLVHPADQAKARELFAAVCRRAGAVRTAELRARHRDGSYRWLDVTATNLLSHPAVKGIVLNSHDITAQVEARLAFQHRAAAEWLVANASRKLVGLKPLDDAINEVLAAVGGFAGADRSYLFKLASNGAASVTHEWCAPGIRSEYGASQNLPVGRYRWALRQLRRGEVVCVPDVARLSRAVAAEQRLARQQAVRSLLAVPVRFGCQLLGVVGFDAVRAARTWDEDTARVLRLVSEMLAQAIVREQMRQALRAAEALARGTLDGMPAHVAVLDAAGRIVAVNRAWREFAQRNKAPVAVAAGVGLDYLAVCRQAAQAGDASAGVAVERLAAVLQGRQATAELEYSCHSARVPRWFLMNVAPLPGGGAVVTHLDITAVKRAEFKLRELSATLEERVQQRTQQLHESEVTARALLESPVDSMYLLDRKGRLLDLNATMARRMRCSREALKGRTLFAILPNQIARLRRAKLAEVFRTGKPVRFEDERHGRWVDQVYTPVFALDGAVAKVAVAARDVTERKHAELAQARLAAIVESSGDAITAMTLDGTITSWNKAAARLYGFAESEAVGRPISLILPPERRRELPKMLRALRRGESLSFETHRLHKDGRRIPVALTISPVKDPATGQIVKGSGIARDVGERQRLEAEVLRAGEMERQRLGHDLHDGLSQQLTAIALHSSALESALEQAGRPEAEQARRIGERIRQAVTASRDLARAMCAVSLQSQGLSPALEELGKLVHEMFGVVCRVRCPRETRMADENLARQLYRIAQESAYNAAKHSRGRCIRIQLREDKHRLQLTVSDDGVGVTEEQLRQSQMGIGIMRYRAGLIGAELQITGRPGHGTTVACTVPKEKNLCQPPRKEPPNITPPCPRNAGCSSWTTIRWCAKAPRR